MDIKISLFYNPYSILQFNDTKVKIKLSVKDNSDDLCNILSAANQILGAVFETLKRFYE